MNHQCYSMYKFKRSFCKYHLDNTSQSWSNDHSDCKQKDLLILKCTCHLKTMSYHLQMAELSVNISSIWSQTILYQNLYDHWPYDIKDILVICVCL